MKFNLNRTIQLEDLWDAYKRGAQETRDFAADLLTSRRDLPTDIEIDKACDAYIKLLIEQENKTTNQCDNCGDTFDGVENMCSWCLNHLDWTGHEIN